MRNPVISAGEFCASDIPDWSFREFGLAFEPGTHVTPESFSTLYAASPIAHVDRVKTPVLLLLGEDDLRVPPTQGKGYYHVLKGKGRRVDMLVFPKETHPIDGVEAARVSFEAGRDWFRAFTGEQWKVGSSCVVMHVSLRILMFDWVIESWCLHDTSSRIPISPSFTVYGLCCFVGQKPS